LLRGGALTMKIAIKAYIILFQLWLMANQGVDAKLLIPEDATPDAVVPEFHHLPKKLFRQHDAALMSAPAMSLMDVAGIPHQDSTQKDLAIAKATESEADKIERNAMRVLHDAGSDSTTQQTTDTKNPVAKGMTKALPTHQPKHKSQEAEAKAPPHKKVVSQHDKPTVQHTKPVDKPAAQHKPIVQQQKKSKHEGEKKAVDKPATQQHKPAAQQQKKSKHEGEKGQQQKKSKHEGEKGDKEGKKEEEMKTSSRIDTSHLWAFVAITSLLIVGTITFEVFKERAMESVRGTPMEQLVRNLFGELTVLGFLGIVTFLLSKAGLGPLSDLVFSEMEDRDEASHALLEMLEQIHFVIFFIMVFFMLEAIGMIMTMSRAQRHFRAMEAEIVTPAGRQRAVKNFGDAYANSTWFSRNFGHVCFGSEFNQAKRLLTFMLLRTDFIYFEEDMNNGNPLAQIQKIQPKVALVGVGERALTDGEVLHPYRAGTRLSPEEAKLEHLKHEFPFFTYLMKVTGGRMAEVVEIGVIQWTQLIFMIILVVSLVQAADGSWQFLLYLWIAIGWGLLLLVWWFSHYVHDLLHRLTHTCKGRSLLEPARDGTTTWISTQASYLDEQTNHPVHRLPEFLVGAPANPRNTGQQKLYNLYIFGRNEVEFQVWLLRIIFLTCSIYNAVFFTCIDAIYVSQTSTLAGAVFITIFAIAPMFIIYTVFMLDIVTTSCLSTSVEHNREKRVLDEVIKLMKEANCLELMRRTTAMFSSKLEPLSMSDLVRVESALHADNEAVRNAGSPVLAREILASHPTLVACMEEMLNDPSAELVMLRHLAVFESMDTDGSNCLSREEIHAIYRDIGFTNNSEVDRCIDHSFSRLDMATIAEAQTAPAASKSGGWCMPKSGTSTPAMHGMSKALFLAWSIQLERTSRLLTPEEIGDFWFAKIDLDSSGHVTVAELSTALANTKVFALDEITSLVLELDCDGDGDFSKEELINWFASRSHTYGE